MSEGEFELIARLVAATPIRRRDVLAGPGDDGALLRSPTGLDLVQTIDTCLEGVHFPADMPAADVGWRSLAVNLSDLAAMGAMPAWGLLSLAVPRTDPAWLDEFARGVAELAQAVGLDVVGGDTVRGPLAVTFALTGFVPPGEALRRSGAAPGDGIWVTGALGSGAAGLAAWQQGEAAAAAAFLRPWPCLVEGVALRGIASAAIDISDGLAQDLGHVLASSGVGAVLDLEAVPVAAAAAAHGQSSGEAMALQGGDDYQLCFTVPASRNPELQHVAAAWPVAPTRIGVIRGEPGLECRRGGRAVKVAAGGWDPFGRDAS